MIATFINHNGKVYRISTINRESSALLGGRYAETLVWEWDRETQTPKSGILAQGEAPEDSIRTHQRFVEQIHAGKLEEVTE